MSEQSERTSSSRTDAYDPFAGGRSRVDVRTVEARDAARDRVFPIEIWSPADEPGPHPLVAFSHGSGQGRRAASFLCEHLASHGYVVAALDHSEMVAAELARGADETDEQKAARADAWIASRVPDLRFLLDHVLATEASVDADRVGVVGHSFGGWTALASTAVDRRIKAVVALAPGGSSRPKPGMLRLELSFVWGRDVPTLYLVGENDTMTPLDGMYELFERTEATKRMFILRRADHLHFVDDVDGQHEAVRAMAWPGDLAWIPKEMRPIGELSSARQAHTFVRGLTLSHLDAALRDRDDARRLLTGDVGAELAARGVDAVAYEP